MAENFTDAQNIWTSAIFMPLCQQRRKTVHPFGMDKARLLYFKGPALQTFGRLCDMQAA